MSAGERLATLAGPAAVLGIQPQHTAGQHKPQTVYNLEVQGQHVFRVTSNGLLVHNAYADEIANGGRGLWKLTENAASKVMRHGKLGKFYKSSSDGLWWAVDHANHSGNSADKVYRETGKGLEWIAHADKYGDFIIGKHKGPIGRFIPWKSLKGI